MITKLKEGDIVICIDDGGNYEIKTGEKYTFIRKEIELGQSYAVVRDESGKIIRSYLLRRFKKMSDEEYEEWNKKMKDIKIKMKDVDPYGEENWMVEKLITKFRIFEEFKLFEELSNPYDDKELPLVYNQHFTNNYMGFREEFLQDLKNKLVGKTIRIDADRLYDWDEKQDPIDNIYTLDGKHIKPLYKIKVKDVQWNGEHRQGVYYINVLSDDNKIYKLRKIVTDKTYNNFLKKAAKELEKIEEEKRRAERLRIKHIDHDPYGEEKWEEDD